MERNRCLKKDVVKPIVQKVIPFGRSKINLYLQRKCMRNKNDMEEF